MTRGTLQRCGGTTCPPGTCDHDDTVHRSAAQSGPATAPPSVHDVLASPGHPLDAGARAYLEPRFGHDFGHVRVHADPAAAASAADVGARAYTVGSHIAFAADTYRPATAEGRKLIAHELMHTLQQHRTPNSPPTALHVGAIDDPAEHAAHAAASSVIDADPHPRRVDGTVLEPHVMRSPDEVKHLEGGAIAAGAAAVAAAAERAEAAAASAAASGPKWTKRDLVWYSGGYNGTFVVVRGGTEIFRGTGISGQGPSKQEYEKDIGPIPSRLWFIHPSVSQPPATKATAGTCGADAISSGFQEIRSDDPIPCDEANHYCVLNCPPDRDKGFKCFTPRSCWGDARIKIEGSVKLPLPGGGKVTRQGFYIHGGLGSVVATDGCIKVTDQAAFAAMRTLKGRVPLCVGDPKACGVTEE